MGVGIECYADGEFELGNPPFFSDQAAFVLGTFDITTPAENTGSIVDALINDGTPWFFFAANSFNAAIHAPTITVGGAGVISWAPSPKGALFSGTVVYGIR